MQILFGKSDKKFLKAMRIFQPVKIVTGNIELFREEIERMGGKYDNHRGGMVVDSGVLEQVENMRIEHEQSTIKENGEIEKTVVGIGLLDECTIEERTDPTPMQTIKRVGRNYLGENLDDYIVVSVDNEMAQSILDALRQAKSVILNELPIQNEDSSYSYYDGLFTIIPPDPPSAEEIEKKTKKEADQQKLKELRSDIKEADISKLSTDEMVKKLFELRQLELNANF